MTIRPRFTYAERLAAETLQARLNDPTSSPSAKTRARNELQRLRESALARAKSKGGTQSGAGESPKREHFDSDALWHERLDEVAAIRKLESPNTKLNGRIQARKTLERIIEARRVRSEASAALQAKTARATAPVESPLPELLKEYGYVAVTSEPNRQQYRRCDNQQLHRDTAICRLVCGCSDNIARDSELAIAEHESGSHDWARLSKKFHLTDGSLPENFLAWFLRSD